MIYSLEFSKSLIDAAQALVPRLSSNNEEEGRAVLYLSLLSCEISLKATLETAGVDVKKLKKRSHNIHLLLEDISDFKLTTTGMSASEIRSKTVKEGVSNGTVGALLSSQARLCSTYPNEIRYGEIITHFPPDLMLDCARVLNTWCAKAIGTLVLETKTIKKRK